MNLYDADRVMRKLDGIWTLRNAHTDEERHEWLDYLLAYDYQAMCEACDALRTQLRWRPSMAELRSSYREVIAIRDSSPLGLPGEVAANAPTLADRYGHRRNDWAYCWRCDMAISLEDQCESAVFSEQLGLAHKMCPKAGTSPIIPEYLRSEREDYRVKHHIKKPSSSGMAGWHYEEGAFS